MEKIRAIVSHWVAETDGRCVGMIGEQRERCVQQSATGTGGTGSPTGVGGGSGAGVGGSAPGTVGAPAGSSGSSTLPPATR